ncbi:hypothetical protein [Bradyrhizobium iriomotense]|uniref:hypothetical protein n=1 Tax=Bradyrhizobium iriomotense TaxID=441950 RepID=UPI0024E05196|nr:hypothetical protein [Bradyrhizobium iriomotense]
MHPQFRDRHAFCWDEDESSATNVAGSELRQEFTMRPARCHIALRLVNPGFPLVRIAHAVQTVDGSLLMMTIIEYFVSAAYRLYLHHMCRTMRL